MSVNYVQRPESTVGAVVFGTAAGFTSRGLGCLSSSDAHLDARLDMRRELDLGRFKEVGLSAWFALPAQSGRSQILLVGEVAPATDNYGRPGIAGAALAMDYAEGALELLELRRVCGLAHELMLWLRRTSIDKNKQLSFDDWKWPSFLKGLPQGPAPAVDPRVVLSVHTFAPEWAELVQDPAALLLSYLKKKRNDVGEGFLALPSESRPSADHVRVEDISDWQQATIQLLEQRLEETAAERDEARTEAKRIRSVAEQKIREAAATAEAEWKAERTKLRDNASKAEEARKAAASELEGARQRAANHEKQRGLAQADAAKARDELQRVKEENARLKERVEKGKRAQAKSGKREQPQSVSAEDGLSGLSGAEPRERTEKTGARSDGRRDQPNRGPAIGIAATGGATAAYRQPTSAYSNFPSSPPPPQHRGDVDSAEDDAYFGGPNLIVAVVLTGMVIVGGLAFAFVMNPNIGARVQDEWKALQGSASSSAAPPAASVSPPPQRAASCDGTREVARVCLNRTTSAVEDLQRRLARDVRELQDRPNPQGPTRADAEDRINDYKHAISLLQDSVHLFSTDQPITERQQERLAELAELLKDGGVVWGDIAVVIDKVSWEEGRVQELARLRETADAAERVSDIAADIAELSTHDDDDDD